MEYVNTSPKEPWDVIYDACLEDAGRIWGTCVDADDTTAGGVAKWDDGILIINVPTQ